MNHKEILDISVKPNEPYNAKEVTLREYLRQLAVAPWTNNPERIFDGKRFNGSGSYDFAVFESLIRAGVLNGKLDEDGYVEELDVEQAKAFVRELISKIFEKEEEATK
ncbi:MAG: hypothetical protein WC777_03375 [Candidatus Gracilibacteria bacterium]|jgi:hypothetical protein